MTPRVEAAHLGELRHLASGGLGEVLEVTDLRLPESPEFPLVYQAFKRRPADVISAFPLESLARLRLEMPLEQRRALDKQFCWVLRVVVDDLPGAAGVLLPKLDGTYYTKKYNPYGEVSEGPCEAQNLTATDDFFQRWRIPNPSMEQRFLLCRSLALGLGKLHRAGVIYGNLSLSEFLYRLDPTPSVMFHNPLQVRLRGSLSSFRGSTHASDWEPPEALAASKSENRVGYETVNLDTDRYKLGLAILRILVASTSPSGASAERDPSRAKGLVPQDVHELLTQCLLGDPRERPTAKDWYLALDRYTSSAWL